MFDLWEALINFTGSTQYSSIDTYILYGAMSCTILIIVVILDHVIKLIKSFFK